MPLSSNSKSNNYYNYYFYTEQRACVCGERACVCGAEKGMESKRAVEGWRDGGQGGWMQWFRRS